MSAPYLTILMLSILVLFFGTCRLLVGLNGREIRCDFGCCKTIGSREVQEDFYQVIITKDGMLAVIADGMGKELGGKIAARRVTEVLTELFKEYNALDNPIYFFQKAFQSANREVLKLFDDGRGSAVASAIMLQKGDFVGDLPTLYYAIVGNVKIAVFRNSELIPVGTGHTVNVLAENKYYCGDLTREDALVMLNETRVYHYIGRDDFKDIEFYDTPIQLRKNDIVVLMSDGVYEELDWRELEKYLGQKKNCRQIALDVIEHINRKQGTKDNACIVLVRVGELL